MRFFYQKWIVVGFVFITAHSCVFAQKQNISGQINKNARDSIVQLLYGQKTSKKISIASSDAIYTEDLVKSPANSIYNSLTGRLLGLYADQSSGAPGSDGVALQLLGQSPLIIIDGIPRSISSLDLETIESVTLLKDALSTAMLGMRGSRGALLITTRKGSDDNKLHFSFTAQRGTQRPLKMPKFLNAYDYASLYNEALQNEGKSPIYTDEDLNAYKNNNDLLAHPNVSWQDQVLKSSAPISRYNMNVTGSGKGIRYLVGLEYFNQEGLFVESSDTKFNNANVNRYIARSNIDIDLSRQTSLSMRVFGRIMESYQPGTGTSNIFSSMINTPNNAYPVFVDSAQTKLGGTSKYKNNIYGQVVNSGYLLNYNRDMVADIALEHRFARVNGLSVRATGSFNASGAQRIDRSKGFDVYQDINTQLAVKTDQANSSNVYQIRRQTYAEFMASYNNRFGMHGLNASVVGSWDHNIENSNLALNYTTVAGRFAYDFQQKYIAEVSWSASSVNRYPSDAMGFFPAVGLGWNIAEEKFMRGSGISSLKLSTSYGKTGWDKAGYFTYRQNYSAGTSIGYMFGTGASAVSGATESSLANENLTWEKADKFNIGLQGGLLRNRLSFNAEYYNSKYYDLLMQRGNASTLIGNSYPDQNIGVYRYSGWEAQLKWQQQVNESFGYFIAANASSVKSKVINIDEATVKYDWMRRTGLPVGQSFGYIAEGLYQSVQDIDDHSATFEGYTPIPGDIKYKDLNNDGLIDLNDIASIGNSKPMIFSGMVLGANWKGFDFSALLQGVINRNMPLTGSGEWEFQNGGFGQAYVHHLDRWTAAKSATATYPRLTVGTNTNNHIMSSYWMRSGNYMRLKNIEIGYSLPSSIVSRAKLLKARVFANATNLLTVAAYDQVDPEVGPSTYPMQQVINVGLTLKF